MLNRRLGVFAAIAIVLGVSNVSTVAQAEEHDSELEIGAVFERRLGTSLTHVGPSFAIEFTPLEHWLELEVGVSRLQVEEATEWQAGVTFKKPFELSSSSELLIGLGPTWTHSNAPGEPTGAWGGEFSLDFQFYTHGRWGWFIEPSYSVGFERGSEKAVAITAGLLIGL